MLPGGPETLDLINAEVLTALGKNGFFINVGRGTSVNDQDLEDALRNKVIAGAGLDVYKNEPQIPVGLKSLDTVVLLPHIGSATVETRRAMGTLVMDNIAAFFADQPLLSEV
jgi:lactate dehydrogenase-like 2-hydroxyacid dehydrogenase